MNLKKIMLALLPLLPLLSFSSAHADVPPPCGVYEAADKADGLLRQAYMEINLTRSGVPDFSFTFKKGEKYQFRLLPDDFMKKPPQYFKGKTAHGFVKYRSKMLFTNTEVCRLSDPKPTAGGWTLTWASDMGKTGTCTLLVENDSVISFKGLGTFAKEINPDGLRFVKVSERTAQKDYLAAGPSGAPSPAPVAPPSGAQPADGEPAASGASGSSERIGTRGRPATPAEPDEAEEPADEQEEADVLDEMDTFGELDYPRRNTGRIVGAWVGENVDGTKFLVRLNTAKSRNRSDEDFTYYGTLMMKGPSYLEEGVVSVQGVEGNCFELFTLPLNTGNVRVNRSTVTLGDKGNLYFLPGSGIEALSQTGQPKSLSKTICCEPLQNRYAGMFTTGPEVVPFPVNFYYEDYYDDGFGGKVPGYGVVTTSVREASRIDSDVITSAQLAADGSIVITWRCGRTDIVYSARLLYSESQRAYRLTQTRTGKNEYGVPDDCLLLGGTLLRSTGPLPLP